LLFLKDQITPKQMSGNLEQIQNVQNPGVSENINEVNWGSETSEPLPETYTEVTN
jgi:hypothetical protein